jgi:hypothetical protein
VRVERHTVGAFGVDDEGAADPFPDADGLEGLFLEMVREGLDVSGDRLMR